MNNTWTNGRHNFIGRYNSSGQRKMSKIYKGMKIRFKELKRAFRELEKESAQK